MSEQQIDKKSLSVTELAAMLKSDGEKVLVLLVGIPASGKSTLARQLIAQTAFVHLNTDSIREELTGDEGCQDYEDQVWATFQARFDNALATGGSILVDNMNITRDKRRTMTIPAEKLGYKVKLVFLDVPLHICIERNKQRGRNLSEFTIMDRFMSFTRLGKPLPGDWTLWLSPTNRAGEYEIAPFNRHQVEMKLDIIGDVHGCLSELKKLVKILGYELHPGGRFSKPYDRMLAFVGDLTDRGPDSAGVLEYCMKLRAKGALFVLGNHCHKLLRALKGENVKVEEDLQKTLDQILARGEEFAKSVIAFLSDISTVFETKELIIVHAAYKELARGERRRALRCSVK